MTLNDKMLNVFTVGITRTLYFLWPEGSYKKKLIGGSDIGSKAE